jgi:20S proteasome subunit alpha 7
MLVPGTNRRIYNVERNIGLVIGGKIPDGRHIMNYARTESAKFNKEFDIPISGKVIPFIMSGFIR